MHNKIYNMHPSIIHVGNLVCRTMMNQEYGNAIVTGFHNEWPEVNGVAVRWLERPDGCRFDPLNKVGGSHPGLNMNDVVIEWKYRPNLSSYEGVKVTHAPTGLSHIFHGDSNKHRTLCMAMLILARVVDDHNDAMKEQQNVSD